MVSEKFSSKKSKSYRGCMAHYLFCHPAISQFFMADISFNTACKELKIAQISQLNKLFQPLHLAHIYGHGFYEVSRMLLIKNVNNDVSKDWPIEVSYTKVWQICYYRSHHNTVVLLRWWGFLWRTPPSLLATRYDCFRQLAPKFCWMDKKYICSLLERSVRVTAWKVYPSTLSPFLAFLV